MPTKEEWAKIKSLPKILRFRLGDKITPDDQSKVFQSYNPGVKNGIRFMPIEKYMVSAKYRVEGGVNPSRKKTPDELEAHYLAKGRRRYPLKMAAHKERMANDPVYAEKQRALYRARYHRQREKILARIKGYQKTPYSIARNRLASSIKRHLLRALAKTNHKHSEGGRFLVWLAQRNGVPIPSPDWHIDHLLPVSTFDLFANGVRAHVNAPENVRWLTAKENLIKNDKPATQEEIQSHLALVAEWRATL